MIHGIISDHTFFDGVAEYLTPEYRLVRYDRRGYGLNEEREIDDYSLEAQIEDAREALEGEPDAVSVIAHSAGSHIAIGLAQKYPALIRGLILIEPALGCDPADRPVLDRFHKRMAEIAQERKLLSGLAVVAEASGERWGSRRSEKTDPDGLARVKRNLMNFMNGEIRVIHGCTADPEKLKRLPQPVLVGVSDCDAMYASVSRHDAEKMNWPCFKLPAGHSCLRYEPETSAQQLLRALKTFDS